MYKKDGTLLETNDGSKFSAKLGSELGSTGGMRLCTYEGNALGVILGNNDGSFNGIVEGIELDV